LFSHELEVAGIRRDAILADKYRLEAVIGVGGMGVVVAAYHLQLEDRVAIKFLRPDCLDSAEAVARFRREARAAVKIKGEHVARVMDVGSLDNGIPYMVMEHLEGSDLAAWLERSGPLRVDRAVEFIVQACEAIAEAHALGIVHRDLKPANLFVVRRPDGTPSVKVLDFGISKLAPGSASSITQATAMIGSPLYMSPEQVLGASTVDGRSDIWSLGVILYELLVGEAPFRGASLPELTHRITGAAPPPARSKRPDLPAALEAVLLKCLAKPRARRYSDVGELALALSEFGTPRARASAERVVSIAAGSGKQTPAWAVNPHSASGSSKRAMLRLWPYATTLTGKRSVRMGMGSAAVVAVAAYVWVAVGSPASVGVSGALAPPAATPEVEPPPASPIPERPAVPGQTAAPAPLEPEATGSPAQTATPAAVAGPTRDRSPRRLARSALPVRGALAAPERAGSAASTAQPVVAGDPDTSPPIRERDASVRSIDDDLRSLKKSSRRSLDTEDPFR
jgi:eukaryotic-like serine/threonine-protein kinase